MFIDTKQQTRLVCDKVARLGLLQEVSEGAEVWQLCCHMIESDLERNLGGYPYDEQGRCESLDCSRFSLLPRGW